MTEDEAKTKWCPFVRYETGEADDNTGANRWADDESPDMCRCIASRCMMWVTTEGRNKQGTCGLAKGG